MRCERDVGRGVPGEVQERAQDVQVVGVRPGRRYEPTERYAWVGGQQRDAMIRTGSHRATLAPGGR